MSIPSCPVCGSTDRGGVVDHPAGRYACGKCWTIYDGGDAEWHRLTQKRLARARTLEHHRESWARVQP